MVNNVSDGCWHSITYIHYKVLGEITHQFPNFNGAAAVEDRE